MNIKRFSIYPVNHQDGNEIECQSGRYVRYDDLERSMGPVLSLVEEMVADLEAKTDTRASMNDWLGRAKQKLEQIK